MIPKSLPSGLTRGWEPVFGSGHAQMKKRMIGLMPDRHQVEQRRRHGKAGKADEHDGDHGVPDKGYVAPQGRHYIFAFHHGLTLLVS
jgi:hypothetical protein